MRNDTLLKVTCTIDDNKTEKLDFEYFDKEGNFVGNIIVDSRGNLNWQVINGLYFETINPSIEYIIGEKNNNHFEYEMPNIDLSRWERALDMIDERNLHVNYSKEMNYENEDINKHIK